MAFARTRGRTVSLMILGKGQGLSKYLVVFGVRRRKAIFVLGEKGRERDGNVFQEGKSSVLG